MSSWIEEELCRAQFNDKRLNERFKKIATDLASNPTHSIHSASIDWAATKAAYRFFDNGEVDSDKILKPHFESTSLRSRNYNKVIVAQDTTYIDYSKHKRTKNLGTSFKSHGQEIKGICQHVGLALNEKGLPLGLVYNKLWTRKDNHLSPYERTSLPIQLKESSRWIECIKRSKEVLENSEIIVVGDRESDIYEAFEEAYKQEVDVIIRSQHNRILDEDIKLIEALSIEEIKGTKEIVIPSSGTRKKKKSKLEIRFLKVELKGKPSDMSSKQNKHREDLELYLVDATDSKAGLNWRLLTTVPVETVNDAKYILDIYAKRWNVELYFKSLKTGCNIEDCRLAEAGKLVKYISLMSVVAWRIFWINFIGRESPKTSSEKVFMNSEWKTAWLILHKKKIKEGKLKKSNMPQSPPELKEVIHWIAGLGGFLRRKGDGDPGLITFWRGWNRLQNGLEIYELME